MIKFKPKFLIPMTTTNMKIIKKPAFRYVFSKWHKTPKVVDYDLSNITELLPYLIKVGF